MRCIGLYVDAEVQRESEVSYIQATLSLLDDLPKVLIRS